VICPCLFRPDWDFPFFFYRRVPLPFFNYCSSAPRFLWGDVFLFDFFSVIVMWPQSGLLGGTFPLLFPTPPPNSFFRDFRCCVLLPVVIRRKRYRDLFSGFPAIGSKGGVGSSRLSSEEGFLSFISPAGRLRLLIFSLSSPFFSLFLFPPFLIFSQIVFSSDLYLSPFPPVFFPLVWGRNSSELSL